MLDQPNYLILGADTPWVRGLCEALTKQGSSVVGLHFVNWRQFCGRLKANRAEADVCEDRFVLVPPSYGTRFEWATRTYLAARITRRFNALAKAAPKDTWLVVTNPVAERWTRNIPDERLIYWNYDDYRLYQPSRAEQIQSWEDDLVRRARLILCASKVQLVRFQTRYPDQASHCVHFPNAVRREWLVHGGNRTAEPNTVGYVGNMGDRVDWQFVHQTASLLPDIRFVFVGRVDPNSRSDEMPEWLVQREKALSLKNVEAVGQVPHEKLAGFYQSFAVVWMPYDVMHRFNIASCPTKIFDSLATGRPFITTDLPECELYAEYIHIVKTPREARSAILSGLSTWSVDKESRQMDFARENDWQARANLLGPLL